ncbi:MAG: MotA/TolQ/ExbB proton channel family protein [Planctomycetes bacterium]|nr:MotA/TolQ/ExbB proton channel family protein [Planctomycetota bacterium]
MINRKAVFSFLLIAFALLWITPWGFAEELAQVEIREGTFLRKDSLWDTFTAGGWVMWHILICMVVGIGFALERAMALRMQVVLPGAFERKYEEVLAEIRSGKRNPESLHRLMGDTTSEGGKLFDKVLNRNFDNVREMEEVLHDYVAETQWVLQKNVKPLGIISQITPLLGLFGTVLGMIGSFDAIASEGMGKPDILAKSMAVALFTTGFGLGVAIPVALIGHHLTEKSTQLCLKLHGLLHRLILSWNDSQPKA